MRRLGRTGEALAHAVGGGVEPLGDGAGEFALALGQHLGHGLHPPDRLGLGAGELDEAGLQFVGAAGLLVGLQRALAGIARDRAQHQDQHEEAERRRAGKRLRQRHRMRADDEEDLIHRALLADLERGRERKVNISPAGASAPLTDARSALISTACPYVLLSSSPIPGCG